MFKCEICGQAFEKRQFIESSKFKDTCGSECFHIKFWQDMVAEKDEHIFIKGESYYIGSDTYPFKGCSGRQFKIKMNDGRIIETDNLWCQGKIPENFKSQLSDNAEFIL